MESIKHRIELINLLPKNPVTVELGVAEGNFSEDILREWKPSIHYAVDTWQTVPNFSGDVSSPQEWHDENYKKASKRLAKYSKIVKILRGITWEEAEKVPDKSVDLVYIDAGHSFNAVTSDINAWFPKLKFGGVMAFHDYLMPQYGVRQAVEAFCKDRFDIYPIPEHKDEDAGAYFIKL